MTTGYRNLTTVCFAAVLALGLAACGGGSSDPVDPPPVTEPDPALGTAQDAADAAADAAEMAADEAETKVTGQDANKAAAEGPYALAQAAALRARDAADAARKASDAAEMATSTPAAQAQQATAEEKQADAEAERDDAVKYAGMVQMAQQVLDDEDQRKDDVASARTAAIGSYTDAEKDATEAETEAAEAEAAAPGSPGAVDARKAATAARLAAKDAKAAHDAITDGMSKAEADAQKNIAADEAAKAKSGYMTAKDENDDIQTQVATGAEQQRKLDVANAREIGGKAVDAAKTAADAATTAAGVAKTAADNAKAAYTKAMNARTDSAAAKTAADAAQAAYTKAQGAADDANAAHLAAKTAIDGVMDDSSSAEAKTARRTAETGQGTAETKSGLATTQSMAANNAATAAATASDKHVRELLMAANAVGVTDDPKTTANDQAVAVKAVRDAIAAAAGLQDQKKEDADNDSSTTDGLSTATAKVTWAADTPAKPAANPPTEEKAGAFKIDAKLDEVQLVFRTKAVAAGDNLAMPKTATKIDGLSGFMHGYEISDKGIHALVFTDKKQATAAVLGKTISLANYPVQLSRIVVDKTDGKNVDLDGSLDVTKTGLGDATKYDHDGDPDTLAVRGTYSCAGVGKCFVQVTDNKIDSITGALNFRTENPQTIVKAKEEAEKEDYLAFGVWLKSFDVAKPEFGAFAYGYDGTAAAVKKEVAGKATYRGAATGVYTAGSSVDYFEGDATLVADFGTKDEKGGTITGIIDGIVAGGNVMSDEINLNSGLVEEDDKSFEGEARMGASTVKGDTTYTYNGSWSGQFYGPATDDPATEVKESPTNTAPSAAAGTFGVTGTDDMGTTTGTNAADDDVTRSYVGAFGAHKQ